MLAIALQGIADAEREDWATVGVQVECPSNSLSSFSDEDEDEGEGEGNLTLLNLTSRNVT
jgi:hypothetical protein